MRKLMLLMLLSVFTLSVWAQPRTVKGKVTNDNGEPVPFATVKEGNSKNSVAADENGNFTIKLKGNSSITVSATNYGSNSITPTENFVVVNDCPGDFGFRTWFPNI